MKILVRELLAATAAIAVIATPAIVMTSAPAHAQGQSGGSQGAAGEAGGGHGVAAGAGGNPGGVGAGQAGAGASAGQGGTASALGGLNAANASPEARANASPNSVVGQLRGYEQAIAADEFDAAAAFLASAANRPISVEVVQEVNDRLGIALHPDIEADIAAAAAAQQ